MRIEKTVALLNDIRVYQPGVRHCPLNLGGTVQLRFYTGPNVPALAVADINAGGCGGVHLRIDGKVEPKLEGGGLLVEEIGRALGTGPGHEKLKADS